MELKFSNLSFDAYGLPETPTLVLETMGGDVIGPLNNVTELTMSIQFAEISEMSFDLPAYSDGVKTQFYDDVVGYKVIRTEDYGVYLVIQPTTTGDGIEEVKHVTAYSIEKELEFKRFFLEEGTFNFWNPADSEDTVLGRALETAPGWSVGYVSPALVGKYRTFDQYDDYLLNFLYNTVQDKFRCIVVFDPYQKTINAYDADEDRPELPIYLGFDNLVEELEVEELSDELVTALRPYGADELDIRAVNPIGTNWIYDISYFISNGDVPDDLGQKWDTWQKSVLNNQQYYKGLVALQSSATAQLLAQQAVLVDLKGELDDLTNQQSVTIQALAMETTDAGKQAQQELLDQINQEIAQKKQQIEDQEAKIADINANLDGDDPNSYTGRILAVNAELSLDNYFTQDELAVLKKYFIEQDVTEETFVASTLDTSVSGTNYSLTGGSVSVSGSSISAVDVDEFQKHMYVLAGGTLSITGEPSLSGDIIRGTLERQDDGQFVFSIYAGTLTAGETTAPSGMVTVAGVMSGFTSDIHEVTVDEITTNEGTQMSFSASDASLYLTANVSDYQKYSVQMELYDYAVDVLSDLATPTYEFSVESGNFIFAQEFQPFREQLELGNGIYLTLHSGEVITPILIGVELEFEDRERLSLTFSNRFKRHDSVNTLKNMIEAGYSSGRRFDAGKYVYNQTSSQMSQVSQFMNSSLDAAVNTVIAAANQSVVLNGAGIQVGGDGKYQIRIVDKMIAFTDDNWATSKMALGLFASDETGEYFGINAEVIGGKLIVGNNMVIENQNDQGVMQFKVDATGAWLNNGTMVFQKDGGGKLLIDPKYGIVAGTSALFDTEGTTVIPSFVDGDGDLVLDEDGMPEDANFFLDLRDGNAYFRGVMSATSGKIGGWTIEDDHIYSGSNDTYVALNASGDWNAAYAIWAGATNPASAPFWVMKNGDMQAKNGTFSGTVSGAIYRDSNGNLMMNDSEQFTSGYLDLYGITIRNKSTGGISFQVDTNGAVTINGNITMGAGSTINWATVGEENQWASSTYQLANTANNTANTANTNASTAVSTAATANSNANSALDNVASLANGTYYSGTFINGTRIYSPELIGDTIKLSAYNGLLTVGTISLRTTTTDAFDITSNYSLRLQSGAGYNVYIGNSSSNIIMHGGGQLALAGSSITINSRNYGTSLPAGVAAGQIFFLIQ